MTQTRAEGTELLLVSDFGLANLAGLLRSGDSESLLHCELAPFGETVGPLLNEARGDDERRGVFVWIRPESALPSFGAVLDGKAIDPETLREDIDRYAELLESAASRFRFVLVAGWTAPPGHRGLGMLDLARGRGVAWAVLEANLRLAERLSGVTGVHLLDASRWVAASDAEEAARLWYLAKIPYTRPTFELAAGDLLGALDGLHGRARKLVVVDLDDTLWGGILGDDGWEGLRLGGHDPVGEAYVDFQRVLKGLTRRGIILGVVSKNDETRALDAMNRHPEMVLRPDDFAGWRINWQDKARNVADLTAELNLGLDAVVFIDDNPSERGRVREALPGVFVPEWPEDPMRYAATLRSLPCFDLPSVNEDDEARTRMYVEERARRAARAEVGSVEDWLASLEVRVRIEPLSKANLPRAAQLLNKTNQMNLRTRRMTESEFAAWAEEPSHRVWTVRVEDRFGDYGLTGIVSLCVNGEGRGATIEDFVLSCRVFGRQVEEVMVHLAANAAREAGADALAAYLLPTPKNDPCRDFWTNRSGFEQRGEEFFRRLDEPYPAPEWVQIETAPEPSAADV